MNDKIRQLISERNSTIEKYNRQIQNEIDKEKEKYTISWNTVILTIVAILLMATAFNVNKKIFPKTSIWSWEYYLGIKPNVVKQN
jgi:hypothetical protein